MTEPNPPIEIGSQTGEQLGQAIRTLLVAVSGYMVGKGWLDGGIAAAAVPVILLGGPLLWGQIRVLTTHGQRSTMANLLPDSVASVK